MEQGQRSFICIWNVVYNEEERVFVGHALSCLERRVTQPVPGSIICHSPCDSPYLVVI